MISMQEPSEETDSPPLLSNKHPAERTLKEFIKVYTNINLTTYEILIVCV